jgi:hypothetical protein
MLKKDEKDLLMMVSIESRLKILEQRLGLVKEPEPKLPKEPDGRYAKIMPHYLLNRDINLGDLQEEIRKSNGEVYSLKTLDRALRACQDIVGWLDRKGVDLNTIH